MSSRPQNIGIKALEIYFPSQVLCFSWTIARAELIPVL